MPIPVAPMLSFDPIAAEFPGFHALELAAHCGTTRRNIQRWKTEGLSVRCADAVAVKIGLHPLSLWGKAWIDAEDELARRETDQAAAALETRRKNDRNYKRRRKERENTAAGWAFMDGRYRQWSAQQDRNMLEAAQRGVQAPIVAL